jgi:1-aminocyclopropane-1-carboxylate deaminase
MKITCASMDTMPDAPVAIQSLQPSWLQGVVAAFDILRLDALHPVVSGNKWYKLKLNLEYAQKNGYRNLITFGGGYSNHLAATAFAARQFGLGAIGIVRGRYQPLTPTLSYCVSIGMQLVFLTHQQYGGKHEPNYLKQLSEQYPDSFMVPEGGDNELGRLGAGLIGKLVPANYTHILVSVGSGTTLAGLRNALPSSQKIIGFAPMKGGTYLTEQIGRHLSTQQNYNWHITDEWHFGGFGKWNDELIRFMNTFYIETKVPLDVVYTAKLLFGARQLVERGEFCSTDSLLCIHTGGLQGNSSVADRLFY